MPGTRRVSAGRWRLHIHGTARRRQGLCSICEPFGAVGSHHVDPRAGWFEYGVTMGAGYRRKGYASEAVVMLLRFMFDERHFHKCGARILADNEASLSLQRRLGFIEEGRLRDQVFSAGRHHDVVMMGLLADEFAQLHLRANELSLRALMPLPAVRQRRLDTGPVPGRT
ncbi:GNAT family N-acetyltransferase [Streptomyces inhibens]|uniref:GNAT family N-acetyltransferase n=1 Tax=Streptomyces inhibens TaxID=2293571 RepID=UPI001EE6A12C|nr:GNAT family protein [Streptomyces inhibens]UKY54853.1 GNAT family N-acetyltransferase [Streptomyces inhibens]